MILGIFFDGKLFAISSIFSSKSLWRRLMEPDLAGRYF